MAVQFLDLAKRLPAASLVAYAVFLVLSLTALGVLTEGRRSGVLMELARLLVTAAVPLITDGWFGVEALGTGVVATLVAIPAASALVLAWLAVHTPAQADPGKAIPG